MAKNVSTTVLAAYHILLALLVVFASAAETTQYQYLEKRRIANSSLMCTTGEQGHILEAFFTTTNEVKVCAENCRDRNVTDGERLGRCLLVQTSSGLRCFQRMSAEDLNVVYHDLCGVGNPTCDLRPDKNSDFPLSVKSWSSITYICIPEREVFDPCDEVSVVLGTQRPFMLTSETLKNGKECHKECELTFTEHSVDERCFYNFLSQDTEKSQKNVVRYMTINTDSINTDSKVSRSKQWPELETRGFVGYFNVSKHTKGVRLQFDISSMDNMSRLWLSLNGVNYDIRCIPLSKGLAREKPNLTTTAATSTATSSTVAKNTKEATEPTEVDNTTLVVAAVSVGVIGFLVFAIVTLLVCRKRKQQRMQQKKSSQRATNYTPVSRNTYEPPPLPVDDDIYAECNPDGPYAVNARRDPKSDTRSKTGSDISEGGYSHLSSPRVMNIDREPSLNYHHVVSVASSDVYNSLQREPKRRKVVDNVYNTCT